MLTTSTNPPTEMVRGAGGGCDRVPARDCGRASVMTHSTSVAFCLCWLASMGIVGDALYEELVDVEVDEDSDDAEEVEGEDGSGGVMDFVEELVEILDVAGDAK